MKPDKTRLRVVDRHDFEAVVSQRDEARGERDNLKAGLHSALGLIAGMADEGDEQADRLLAELRGLVA